MIKITPPIFEQFIRREHDAYLLAVKDATSQAECLRSVSTLRDARLLARSINNQFPEEYPRWIAVSKDSCYFDPDAKPAAWIPVRHPVTVYKGPFMLVEVPA